MGNWRGSVEENDGAMGEPLGLWKSEVKGDVGNWRGRRGEAVLRREMHLTRGVHR
jgi:hypothetical protein